MKKAFIFFSLLIFNLCIVFAQNVQEANKEPAENVITLTVDDASEFAKKNNLSIKTSEISLAKNEKLYKFSFGGIGPSASMNASYTPELLDSNSSVWNLSATVGLSLTPSLYTNIQNAKLNYEQSLEDYDNTIKTVEMNVRVSFFNLLYSKESLTLQKRNLETARQRYSANRDKYNKGQLSELDLLTSQYAYESLKPAVESASMSYDNSLAVFKQLIGIPQDQKIELKGSLSEYVNSKDINYEYDIQNIPALKTEERKIQSANNSLLSTRFTAYAPSLTASYNYNYRNDGTFDTSTQNISIGARIPLDGLIPWSSGALSIENQKVALNTLKMQYENDKVSTDIQIKNSINNLKQAKAQLKLLETNVELAQKTYNLTLTAYNHGARDLLTLQNASDALFSAKIKLQQQMLTVLSSTLSLENTLGIPFGTLDK